MEEKCFDFKGSIVTVNEKGIIYKNYKHSFKGVRGLLDYHDMNLKDSFYFVDKICTLLFRILHNLAYDKHSTSNSMFRTTKHRTGKDSNYRKIKSMLSKLQDLKEELKFDLRVQA